MTSKEFLSVKDLATRYSIHPKTVERMARHGELPACIRLGKRLRRWRLSDIEEFENAEKGAR